MNALIAVPSEAPGGLAAQISGHFGHCEAFTLVALQDGKVSEVRVVAAPPHEGGGCMVPVNLLAKAGVTAIVAGGMGRRPLYGFLESGIQPLSAGDCATVAAAVDAYASGKLSPFGPELVCGGEEHGHGC